MAKKVIIVTGPIGSGKSTAINYFREQGFETIDLDKVSNLILFNESTKIFIIENFPEVIIDNLINKKLLADIVFSDKKKLEILEDYLHPKILLELQNKVEETKGVLFVEVSAPKNIQEEFECLVIISNKNSRKDRLIKRGMHIDDIKNRMNIQKSDDWWKAWAK